MPKTLAKAPENATLARVSDPIAEAKETLRLINKAKRKLLKADDHIIKISGKDYVKREGWRVLAMIPHLNFEILKIEKNSEHGEVSVLVRVSDQFGRFIDGIGGSSKDEDFYMRGNLIKWGEHEEAPEGYRETYFLPVFKGYGKNRKKIGMAWFIPKGFGALVAIAHTRALNRAIADYFGGKPSAEEVEAESLDEKSVFEARIEAVKNMLLSKYPLEQARETLKKVTGLATTADFTEETLVKMEEHLGITVEL